MRTKAFLAPLALFVLFALIAPPSQAQLGSSGFFLSQAACSYPLPVGSDTVGAAYGLRLLRSGYATPSKFVRVQRASDNTQQDIGTANGCDFDTATFNTFCNATTCFVAKWYDQSGNGVDLSQSTLANMPQLLLNQQNSHPAMTFNGTSTEMTGTLTSSIQFGTFDAVAETGTFSAGHYFVDMGTSVSENIGFNTVTSSPNCSATSNHSSVHQSGTIACTASTYYRWIGIIGSSLASIYLGGTKGTDATSSTFQATAGTSLVLGAAISNILFWNGAAAELIIFNPNTSSGDALTVSSNQGAYWGL